MASLFAPVAVALVAAAPLAGCDGADFPSALVGESPHFAYFARPDDATPCASLLDLFEEHLAIVDGYLDLRWPPTQKITYYKFADDADARRNAGCVREACSSGTTVRSDQSFHEHELIHAYLELRGNPPAMFEEGIAVTLACDQVEDAAPALTWAEALTSNDPLQEAGIYGAGARLVHYLLDRYGAPPFMQLYAELPHDASPDTVDQAMRRIYGAPAEQLWQQALAAPTGCLPLWPCSRPGLPIDGTPVAVGTQCGLAQDWRTFTLPADGNVAISSNADLDTRLTSCARGRAKARSFPVSPAAIGRREVGVLDLPSGRYFVRFNNRSAELAVNAATVPWTGLVCEDLQPMLIAPDDNPALRFMPPPALRDLIGAPRGGGGGAGSGAGGPDPVVGPWIAKLRFEGPHMLQVLAGINKARVCPTCNPESEGCDPPSTLQPLWSGDFILRFESSVDILPR